MSRTKMNDEDRREMNKLKGQLNEIYRKIKKIEDRNQVTCPHCMGSGKVTKKTSDYDHPHHRYDYRTSATWPKD